MLTLLKIYHLPSSAEDRSTDSSSIDLNFIKLSTCTRPGSGRPMWV